MRTEKDLIELGKAFDNQDDLLGDIMIALHIAEHFVFKSNDKNASDDDRNAALFAMQQLKESIERFNNRYYEVFDKLKATRKS